MPKRSVLIVESIPLKEGPTEGDVLSKILEMASYDYFELHTVTNKNDLLSMLEDRQFMKRFRIVHLSGHGDEEEPNFLLPRGCVHASEFPEACFRNRTVCLSACTLGRSAFVRPFLEATGARFVIGPRRAVYLADAALFFMTFYYWTNRRRLGIEASYNRAVKSAARGDFQLWVP
ncbi:MAG: hypothetical protein ISF22_05905 [Methanomassiliicoccus sp.]|nr:hypothetical protein [Methanomassiliicoccus sp.]